VEAAGISSAQFESHAAFDPRTGDFHFVRSSPQFTGWRIFVSQCGRQGEFFVWYGHGREAWPPDCPVR